MLTVGRKETSVGSDDGPGLEKPAKGSVFSLQMLHIFLGLILSPLVKKKVVITQKTPPFKFKYK